MPASGTCHCCSRLAAPAHIKADGWRRELARLPHRKTASSPLAASAPRPRLPARKVHGFEANLIQCPCHGAEFNLDGTVHHPPATAALRLYGTRVDATTGQVVIDTLDANGGLPAILDGQIAITPGALPNLATVPSGFAYTPDGLSRSDLDPAHRPSNVFRGRRHLHLRRACRSTSTIKALVLNCPCHGCAFNPDGSVKNGPATVPLKSYTTSYIASVDLLTITVSSP